MKKIITIITGAALVFTAIYSGYSLTKSSKKRTVQQKKDTKINTNTSQPPKSVNKPPKTTKNELKKIKLYFPSNERLKIEEIADKFQPEVALNLLLGGPKKPGNVSYIPKGTSLLSFKIEKGNAVINFSRQILDPGNIGAKDEELTLYSFANTLTQFPKIKGVIIQVEGKTEGELDGRFVEDFWGHIGLYDQPFQRNENLVASQ